LPLRRVTTKEGDFAVKKQFLNPTALKVNTFTLIIEGEFEFMILSQKINDARIFPLYSDKMQTLKHGVLTVRLRRFRSCRIVLHSCSDVIGFFVLAIAYYINCIRDNFRPVQDGDRAG
jgi:hypothetical protein